MKNLSFFYPRFNKEYLKEIYSHNKFITLHDKYKNGFGGTNVWIEIYFDLRKMERE